MAQTVIMERQTLSFVYQESRGAWVNSSNPSLFLPVDGTEYTVDWGGTTYNCMAFVTDAAPGNVLLGNPMPLGGEDNGVPFLMSSLADGSGMSIMTFDEGETREVGVWLVEEDVQAPSATVKIKGYSGAEHTYENVPKVWLAAPESTAENPVLVPFTYGEALDNVEVVPDFSGGDQKVTMPDGYMARSAVVKKPAELVPGNIKAGETVAGITGEYEGEAPETEEKTVAADFSGGDMVLEPSDGRVLSKATVTRPETLIPENIAEGVNIAGIVGALAGGKDVKIYNSWYVKPSTATSHKINHNLGVVPDIIIFHGSSYLTSSANKMLVIWGCSDAACTKFGLTYKQYVLYQTPAPAVTNSMTQTASITATSVTAGKAWISNATETSIKIHYYNGNNGQLDTSNYHHVLIIGGLT